MNFVTFELCEALSILAISMAHFLIGSAMRFSLRRFLHVHFFRLTSLGFDDLDESNEEEYEKFGYGSESGSFGTFDTELGEFWGGL